MSHILLHRSIYKMNTQRAVQLMQRKNPDATCSGTCKRPLREAKRLWFQMADGTWHCPSCIIKNPSNYPDGWESMAKE